MWSFICYSRCWWRCTWKKEVLITPQRCPSGLITWRIMMISALRLSWKIVAGIADCLAIWSSVLTQRSQIACLMQCRYWDVNPMDAVLLDENGAVWPMDASVEEELVLQFDWVAGVVGLILWVRPYFFLLVLARSYLLYPYSDFVVMAVPWGILAHCKLLAAIVGL